ncbi:biotin--[acetyl-CoA-carboxylase] ligase [Companilactobacillus sp. HBUAS59699]|uniref:biotin--[acetyl-CoA-carboxylase] ligase n=1 Tax=Companilactobacillus sp. HBUAS59699 TaxID=3109358 RepID=UPI002FEEE2F5
MTNIPINRSTIENKIDQPIKILTFKKINSTNTFAKEYLLDHPNQTVAIIADAQTAGYGRFKRDFYSPQQTGIYLSIIIPTTITNPGLLTTMAGLASITALKKNFPEENLKLKWINDLLLNNKKVGGILAENINNSNGNHLVLGIGINLNTADFPKELQTIATSISSNDSIDRNIVIADILNQFFSRFPTYQTGDFLPEYRKLCDTLNKTVRIVNGNTELTGTAVDINSNGALILEDTKKLRHIINSGEVTKVFLK